MRKKGRKLAPIDAVSDNQEIYTGIISVVDKYAGENGELYPPHAIEPAQKFFPRRHGCAADEIPQFAKGGEIFVCLIHGDFAENCPAVALFSARNSLNAAQDKTKTNELCKLHPPCNRSDLAARYEGFKTKPFIRIPYE